MIHEIHPHLFDNAYRPQAECLDNDYILHYSGKSMLLKKTGGEYTIPTKTDFPEFSDITKKIFLFRLNGRSCFLLMDEMNLESDLLSFEDLNFFRTISKEYAWISMAGFQLRNWYRQHQFCGKCGDVTTPVDNERAIKCTKCGHTVFPGISPAIIVAITSGDKILLIKGVNSTSPRHSLVAGYVDTGESLEAAVAREVKEEVGLDVTNIRYYQSQPWPLTSALMLGFTAEADAQQPIKIDPKEIGQAAWFKRGELPEYSSTLSIGGEMIKRFNEGTL